VEIHEFFDRELKIIGLRKLRKIQNMEEAIQQVRKIRL
jgi:hypothetical protein